MKCSLHLGASPLLILAQTHKCIHVYTHTHGPRKNSKKHNNGGEKKCCWTSWTEAGTASQLIQPIRFGPDSCRTASRTKTTPRPLLRWRQITQRHRQTGGGRERKTERYREEYRRVKAVTRVEFSRLKKQTCSLVDTFGPRNQNAPSTQRISLVFFLLSAVWLSGCLGPFSNIRQSNSQGTICYLS